MWADPDLLNTSIENHVQVGRGIGFKLSTAIEGTLFFDSENSDADQDAITDGSQTKRMNKLWFVTALLLGFIFAGSCQLPNEKNTPANTWLKRICCDYSGEINISNIEINANFINIKFCTNKIEKARLSLSYLENSSCETVLDTTWDSTDPNLMLEYSNLYKKETSSCFIGKKLKDGRYRLHLATGHGCGALYFRLLNGKFISDKRICIEKCVGSQY